MWLHIVALGLFDGVSEPPATGGGGGGGKRKKWYVRNGRNIYIFDTAESADSWIEANEAIEKAKSKSLKVNKKQPKKSAVKPKQIIDVGLLPELAKRFSEFSFLSDKSLYKSAMPHESVDYANFIIAYNQLLRAQDEEDMELLLLAI